MAGLEVGEWRIEGWLARNKKMAGCGSIRAMPHSDTIFAGRGVVGGRDVRHCGDASARLSIVDMWSDVDNTGGYSSEYSLP